MILYTLLVILWGAWVRISFSGDGCGDSWPLCDGKVIPGEITLKTFNEYFHRLTSGLYGIFALILWLWSKKVFLNTHPARKFALLTLIFTISEALLGAKLVLFGLVTDNDSPFRAIVMAAHLMNSLALMAFVTLTADFSTSEKWIQKKSVNIKPYLLKSIYFGFFIIGVTGAIAALSTTLFPSDSLSQGLWEDFSKDSHYLIKLRVLHPLSALIIGLSLSYWSFALWQKLDLTNTVRKRAIRFSVLCFSAIIIGIITLLTLSPIPLKIIHLTIAHGMWIGLILLLNSFNWEKVN